MGRLIIRGMVKYIVYLIIIRVAFVYMTKDAFIDSGFIALIIGSIIGRVIFLKIKN